jgi:hypothetical protein
MMFQFEPIATAPVLDLTPHDVDTIIDELRAYHSIYSPLFQRREQGVLTTHEQEVTLRKTVIKSSGRFSHCDAV